MANPDAQPDLGSLAEALGMDPDELGGLLGSLGGGAGESGSSGSSNSLKDAFASSFYSTGKWRGNLSLAGKLPPWARGLAKELKNEEGFDPWLGMSTDADDPVYMGSKTKTVKTVTPPSQRGREAESFYRFADGPGQAGMWLSGGGDRGEEYHKEPGEVTEYEETTSKVMSLERAFNLIYKWDEEKFAEVQERMRGAGLKADTFDEVERNWQGLVSRASKYFTATKGERQLTPWDVLEMMKRENGLGEDGDGSGGAGGLDPNRTSTHVSRSVSEITEGQAWSVMQNMVSQMLGRDPTDEELREYVYKMNHMAASNPAISKTITKYKNGEAVSSNTRTDPGFTSEDMAQAMYEEAQADPDYAEYQSATTYFNALLSALGPLGG